jgi:homotetrameric NADPH-dependent glutamate synthase
VFQILHREQFSEQTFLWEVFAPAVARAARPGQFVMIRLSEQGERIPLTIADFDVERGTVTLVIQALGRTTIDMRDRFAEGDWFPDFAGPLGQPSEVEDFGRVVVVGGGLGVAPIYPQCRALALAGCRVTAIVGFRSADLIFWQDKLARWCDELILCTDDGSAGRPGFVTGPLAELCASDSPPDRVIAIGPMPMMHAVAQATAPHGVETVVSLNAIMVDGTGMCGSCRVTVGGQVRFACVDGPEFDAHAVDFDELKVRQRRFAEHEARARDDQSHVCNLEHELIDEGKRNYKKLKQVNPSATPMPERDAVIRAGTFDEVNLGYGLGEALLEAERCIQCRRPTCVAGCPVGIDIPGFIRQLLVRDLAGSLATIQASNLFPSVCGRVCPQESQCEAQCILAKKMEPVAIGRLERFVGDHAPVPEVVPVPRPASHARIAIVGSGPAGLACAGDLARAGHEVIVYEALHVVGGVLRYGIPSFRLPRSVIDREVEALQKLGVKVVTNTIVGRTTTVAELRDNDRFDAVFLGTGAGYPAFMGIPGESAGEVYSANEFLTRVNLMAGDRFPLADTPVHLGKKVVVVGAGNTAMDCARVARRVGADEVHLVYRRTEAEAPARKEELRHAREEGVTFDFLRNPTEVHLDDDGRVCGIRVQHMALGEPDASGRRRPTPVDGAFDDIDCDSVIVALGTRANPVLGQTTPDLALNQWGYIVADSASQATNLPGVFAGGDIVTGGATVILALGAGRRAAKAIQGWLADRNTWPPALDVDAAPAVEAGPVCPRCRKPVDGEAFVCCADEAVHWHCRACHARFEGFAFPYGLCPACGGTLARDDDPSLDAEGARAVRMAMEIELGGVALYTRGAAESTDPELTELFERLADMEREHLELLARRYHLAPPHPGEVRSDQLAIYAGLPERPLTPIALLELAISLECRARDAFAAQAAALPEGSASWKLFRELEAEEWGHVALLKTELAQRIRGKRGLF